MRLNKDQPRQERVNPSEKQLLKAFPTWLSELPEALRRIAKKKKEEQEAQDVNENM